MIRFSPNPNRAHLISWHEWGPRAFRQAKAQDKVVMLYLGAFWCGFCHKMDETSFSDKEVIVLLNAFFIPIRVENAQRPDIDVRYNHNGWPTIVFMTPRGDSLALANYLPPEDFATVLVRVHSAYEENRAEFQRIPAGSNPTSPEGPGGRPPTPDNIRLSATGEITSTLMGLADPVNGGCGRDHKFPHPDANDFLLYRYQTTGDAGFLDHVRLTLDRMRASKTYDPKNGGFFRYSSKPDWSEPHREKLLCDQAGILQNALGVFRLTGLSEYRRLAGEIIDYLDTTLGDPSSGAFFGCQDYVCIPENSVGKTLAGAETGVAILDEWIYTDANALTVSAYLEASQILERPDCSQRALTALEFLWRHCRAPDGCMQHYHDGEAHVPGLLVDQVVTGLALLDAYAATRQAHWLERAAWLADDVLRTHSNPLGGFQDIRAPGKAHLRFPLTLLVENGLAARLFLRLARSTGKRTHRQGAVWALAAFTGDFTPYGVFAAPYGRALGEYLGLPLLH